jgi:hypothetical protein
MLLFLPQPYPDELFYSICARYHAQSGNKSFKDSQNDLFGVKTASAVFDLPNRLDAFQNMLNDGTKFTSERIIWEHTLFPLYKPFLPQERAEKIIESMKRSDRGGTIHSQIGIMASSIPVTRYMRYCPKCHQADKDKYGEPYWHRIHQVSGVIVCPIHKAGLYESDIAIHLPNKHTFHILPNQLTNFKMDNDSLWFDKDLFIAESAFWILNHAVSQYRTLDFTKLYLPFLQQKNLATISGRIKQNDLIQEFVSYYGQQFLKRIYCEIKDSQDNWLNKMVRKPRGTTHPLHHLLLIGFLGINPEELFKMDGRANEPFGKGQWPCLNPAASHYHKNIIRKVSIIRDTKIKVPVGKFECSCGFIYSRRGPDQGIQDKYRIGRIQSFGPVWNRRLLHLTLYDNLSFRETARQLNVDPKTVKNQLKKLKVEIGSNNGPECLQLKDKIRLEWLKLMTDNPEKTRSELRKLAYRQYAWLYRHDNEWLKQNQPASIKKISSNNRVDWEALDREMVEKVNDAVQKIMLKKKPVRVTQSAIGNEIGARSLIEKHLDKLPKTKDFLDTVTESIEQFQCRRVRYVSQRCSENKEALKSWKIIRQAGLSPQISSMVLDQIEAVITMERTLQ